MPINPEDVTSVRSLLPSLGDSDKKHALSFIQQFEDEQVQRREQTRTVRGMLSGNLSSVDEFAPVLKDSLRIDKDPDQLRARTANISLLSMRSGKSAEEVASGYELYRDNYAQESWDQGWQGITDVDFYNLASKEIGQEVKREEVTKAANLAGATRATWSGMNNVKALAEYQKTGDDRDDQAFLEGYFGMAEKMRPYRRTIESVAKDAKEILTPGSPTVGGSWDEIAKKLLEIPKEDRGLVIESIGRSAAAQEGVDKEGAFQRVLLGFDRGLENLSSSALSGLGDYMLNDYENQLSILPDWYRRLGMSDDDLASIKEMRKSRAELINLRDDIRDVAHSKVRPIEKVTLLGMNLSGAAEQVPLTLAAFVPYAGIPIITASMKRHTYNELRREYPDMTEDQLQTASSWAAPFQAVTEVVTDRLMLGRLPNFKRAFTGPAFSAAGIARQYGLRAAVGTGIEYTEEAIQGATPRAVMEIMSALSKDVPEVDWMGWGSSFVKETPELLAVIIPMALIGAGVGQVDSFVNGRTLVSSEELLKAAGFENYEAIRAAADAKNWSGVENLMKAEWKRVAANGEGTGDILNRAGAAVATEQLDKLKGEIRQQLQDADEASKLLAMAESQLGMPTVKKDSATGEWMVADKEGNVSRFGTAIEATTFATQGLSGVDSEMVSSMIGLFDNYAGTGEDLDQVLNRLQTLQGDVDEGRISLEDAKAAVVTANRLDGLSQQQAEDLSNVVFGSNVTEIRDGMVRSVSRILAGGNAATKVEEITEGRVKAGLASGYFDLQKLIGWLRIADEATGMNGPNNGKLARLLPTDAEPTLRDVIEGISKVVVAEVIRGRKSGSAVGSSMTRALKAFGRKGAEVDAMAKGEAMSFAGFINTMKAYFVDIFRRVRAMARARKDGKLDPEWESTLQDLMGKSAQELYDEGVTKTAEAAVNVPTHSIGRAVTLAPAMQGDPDIMAKVAVFERKVKRLASKDKEAMDSFFNVFWPEVMKRSGQNLKPNIKNLGEAAQRAVDDIEQWLKSNPQFLDYYGTDWKVTRSILDIVFPGFTDDQFAGFRLFTGVTSPATPLEGNLADSVQLMDLWLRTGSFAEMTLITDAKGRRSSGPGPFKLRASTGANKTFTLHILERLFNKLGTWEAVTSYLKQGVTSKEVGAFNQEMGYKGKQIGDIGKVRRVIQIATGQEELIPRMFIFGPKVGAYTLNTSGDSRYTTTDIWEARYIRSYFPTMFKAGTGLPTGDLEHQIFQEFTVEFQRILQEKLGGEPMAPSALQAVRWFYMLESARKAGYRYANTSGTISDYTRHAARKNLGVDVPVGGSGSGSNATSGATPAGRKADDDLGGVSQVYPVASTQTGGLRGRRGLGGGSKRVRPYDEKRPGAPTYSLGKRQRLIGLDGKVANINIPGRGIVSFGPLEIAREAAEAYMERAGMPYNPPATYAKVDPERGSRIAQVYNEAVHSPNDPEVKAAYAQMIKETLAQYQLIKETGLTIEPITEDMVNPYKLTPRLAILDVIENNHLWFFPTNQGFGSNPDVDMSDNLMLQVTGETLNGRPLLANDIFRIVHDYFGHIKEGVGFRADGEENAWRSHAAMYSPQARRAITSETRGQNSWLNYSQQLLREAVGDAKAKESHPNDWLTITVAAHNKTATEDTAFAPQKTVLLPEWVMEEAAGDEDVRQDDDPYRDRSEDSTIPLTPTEVHEGIEAEQGTVVEADIDLGRLGEQLDEESLPLLPWPDETYSLSPWKHVKLSDLDGKTGFAFYADRMRVGTYTGLDPKSKISIPLQGGIDFPSQAEMIEHGIAWAVSDQKTHKSMVSSARRTGGTALVALFSRGNITGNATFLKAYFEELRFNIRTGKITEQAALDFINTAKSSEGVHKMVVIPPKPFKASLKWHKKASKRLKAGEITQEEFFAEGRLKENKRKGSEEFELIPPTAARTAAYEKAREEFINFKWSTTEQAEAAMAALSFKARGGGFFFTAVKDGKLAGGKLGTKTLIKAGLPDIVAMVDAMEEPAFTNLPLGTIMAVLEIDTEQKFQKLTDLGRTNHLSYAYAVRGKRVGRFERQHKLTDFIPLKKGSTRIMEGEAMAANVEFAGFQSMSLSKPNLVRKPQVVAAAKALGRGDITMAQYQKVIEEYDPILPIPAVPRFATEDEMLTALGKKGEHAGRSNWKITVEGGMVVGVRLDIPAYKEHGVWVVTLHEERKSMNAGNVGNVIGYSATSHLKNVRFATNPFVAFKIATGQSDKSTIASAEGEFVDTSDEDAQAMAEKFLNDPEWTQVGMNPFRHSWFYDRQNKPGMPVVSAEEVIQIGGMLLAKGVVYADPTDNNHFGIYGKKISPEALEKAGANPGQTFSIGKRSLAERMIPDISKRVNATPEIRAAFWQRARELMLAIDWDTSAPAPRTKKSLQEEASKMREAEYERLMRDVFKADTKAKQAALPSMDRAAAKSEARSLASAWMDEQIKAQSIGKKRSVVDAIKTLDALVAGLPAPIRGLVGGYAPLASIQTFEKREEYLKERLKMIDTVLEDHLKKELSEDINELLKKGAAKREAGERATGKLTAEVHDIVAVATGFAAMTEDEVSAERLAIQDFLLNHPEQAVDLAERENLLDLFGDLKGKSAAELDAAHKYLSGLIKRGRSIWKALLEMRQNDLDDLVELGLKDLNVAGDDASIQADRVAAKKVGHKSSDFMVINYSFEQLLSRVFGQNSPLVMHFVSAMRASTSEKADAMIERRQNFDAMMSAVFRGMRKSKWSRELYELSQIDGPRQVKLKKMEGAGTKTIEVPADVVEKMIAGTVEGKAFGLDLLEEQTIKDAWVVNNALPAKNRKRKLTIERAIPGTESVVPLSQLQAINLLMLHAQEGYKETLALHGWSDTVMQDMESQLTPEAKAIRSWLTLEYAQGWEPLNAVYSRMYGANLPRIRNYSPGTFEARQMEAAGMDPYGQQLLGEGGFRASMNKTRRKHSARPRLEDALAVYWNHVNAVEHFKAFGESVRDMKAVISRDSVRMAVTAKFGADTLEAVQAWVKAFEINGVEQARIGRAFDTFIRNRQSALSYLGLAYNLGTLAKQSTAALGTLMDMGPADAARQVSKLMTGQLDLSRSWNSRVIQRRIDSGYSPEVRMAMMAMMAERPNWRQPFVQYGIETVGLVDGFFTTASHAMAWDLHYQRAIAANVPTILAEEIADKAAESAVGRTAQPAEMMDKSLFELGLSPPARMLFMFYSEARQKAALAVEAYLPSSGLPKGVRASRIMILHVLFPLMIQTVSNIWQDMRGDDDDELFDEKYWGAADYVKSMIIGPLIGIPFVGSAANAGLTAIIGGRTFSVDPVSPIDKGFQAVAKLASEGVEADSDLIMKATVDGLSAIGFAMGGNYAAYGVAAGIVEDVYRVTKNAMK